MLGTPSRPKGLVKSPTSTATSPIGRATSNPSTLTDRSGSIATANTSQQVAAENRTRRFFFFENISDTDMWINIGAAAATSQGSILVKANGGSLTYEGSFVPSGAINVICATVSKTFTAKEG